MNDAEPCAPHFFVKGMIPIIREIREELLSREAFEIYSQCMYRPNPEKYSAFADEILSRPSVCAFGFFDEDRLTGILILDKCEILGIAVSADLHRRGVGRALIQHAAEKLHLARMTAETDDDAVGFYQACGFDCTRFERTFPDGTAIRYRCIRNFF